MYMGLRWGIDILRGLVVRAIPTNKLPRRDARQFVYTKQVVAVLPQLCPAR